MLPRIKQLLRFSIVCCTVVVVLFYLMACLVPFLNAEKYWFEALLGLIFPLLFILLAAITVYWVLHKSKWAFVCIISMLLGWQQLAVLAGLRFYKKFDVVKTPETLRILSWNLSSWGETNRANKRRSNFRNEMIEEIKKTKADVLCFQEYIFYKDSRYWDSIMPALKESGYQYSYFAKTNFEERLYKSTVLTSVAIISKFPITDTARFYYEEDEVAEPLMFADIKINNNTIRVFTTHLQSVRFGSHDYETLHQLKEPDKSSILQTRAIVYKLKYAYKKRGKEADLINKKIKESPYPVIICGDFNDVPNSYTYFTIKENLQDAFLKKGSGFGRTFRYISPTLRIDYILADKKFKVNQFNILELTYSDHYPVIADFELDNLSE